MTVAPGPFSCSQLIDMYIIEFLLMKKNSHQVTCMVPELEFYCTLFLFPSLVVWAPSPHQSEHKRLWENVESDVGVWLVCNLFVLCRHVLSRLLWSTWMSLMTTPTVALPGDARSADCARFSGTRSSRSLCRWPRFLTTRCTELVVPMPSRKR